MVGAAPTMTNSSEVTGAVILAAGAGSRLGHRPKCLLELDGVSLIHRQIQAISALGNVTIVVVLGHHGHLITPMLEDQPVIIVQQPKDQHRQSDSVHLGVATLASEVRQVLVCPSDLPLLDAKDYRAVHNIFLKRGPCEHFVGPEVGGIPGHPVVFDSKVIDQIISGDKTFGSGAWRTANQQHTLRWQTTNDHFIRDIDSEEDRCQFEMQTQRQLQWPKGLV